MPLIKSVAKYGFNSKKLTEAIFPSLEDAGYESFRYSKFSTINFPSLLRLSNYTFEECKQLRQFVALKLLNISKRCFIRCQKLEIVIAPLASVSHKAFQSCRNLHTVLVSNADFNCNCKNCPKCKN